jgi:hypothetical protein
MPWASNEPTTIDQMPDVNGLIRKTEVKTPYPGQVHRWVDFDESSTDYEDDRPVMVTDHANVATSTIEGTLSVEHKLLVDIDLPCKLIESTTPGHFHFYVDKKISYKQLINILKAMSDAGIVEPGYYKASKSRGYTSVRLPWIKKVK